MGFAADKHPSAEGTTGPVELSAALTAAEGLEKGGVFPQEKGGASLQEEAGLSLRKRADVSSGRG